MRTAFNLQMNRRPPAHLSAPPMQAGATAGFAIKKETTMSSIDQENLRRAEKEIRNSVGNRNEGSGAVWFLGIVVIAAIVGALYMLSGNPSTTPADNGALTPPVADQVTPAPVPTE